MLDPAVLPVFFLAVLALAVAPGPDLTLIVSHALARGAPSRRVVFRGHRLGRIPSDSLGGVRLGAPHATHAGHRRRRAVRWSGLSPVDRDRPAQEGEAYRRGGLGGATGDRPRAPRGWVWRGLVNNLLNPKALLFFSLFLPQFATAPAEEVPLQIAVLGGLLTITVMTVNLGVAWGAGSVRRAFNPSGRFDHVATGVLGLVFVGLALRLVFQEIRAR